MNRQAIRFLPFFLIVALPFPQAYAGTVEASSRVKEVTVYTDRALVARAAKVHLPAGESVISLADLPAGLIESTLRVQGKATAAVKLGTVKMKRIYLSELANATEREKNAQLEAKMNEKALLEAKIKALQSKENFITRVVEAGAFRHDDRGNAKLDFTPEKWQQAWGLVQTGMAETQKDLATENLALTKINAEIEKLQQELLQVRSQQAKERRDVQVSVEAAAETDLDLVLSYQTSGASWRPVYDARLDTNNAQLVLEQYGSVVQSTGEDWDDVSLIFSTAQPARGSEMPPMLEWRVGLEQVMQSLGFSSMDDTVLGDVPLRKAARSMEAMPAAAPVMEEMKAVQETAQATTTEYSAEFKVPGLVDLKSTRDATKLYVGEVKMKADFFVQTSPRLALQAYLFAKAKNGETYPLIPGEVAKYRDGAFIGNARLPLVRPDEETKFAFGVDDRVKVDYKRLEENQENPTLIVVGDVTVERQYQTKVQNLHKDPISITVLDQYPVSRDSDVTVTFLDKKTTPGFTDPEEKRQGVIAWTGTYKPKEEKTFTLGFKVEYPKGRMIEGM